MEKFYTVRYRYADEYYSDEVAFETKANSFQEAESIFWEKVKENPEAFLTINGIDKNE